MATTQLSIINLALSFLACERLTSLSGSDKRTEVMLDIFEPTRDLVLEDGGWTFARKRVELTALTDVPDFGWEHKFTVPTDLLKIWKEENDYPFTLEGGYILSDSSTLQLTYISKVTDYNVFTPGFTYSLALKLAASAAYSLSQDKGAEDRLEAKYQASLDKSRNNSSQNETPEDFLVESILGGRSGVWS